MILPVSGANLISNTANNSRQGKRNVSVKVNSIIKGMTSPQQKNPKSPSSTSTDHKASVDKNNKKDTLHNKTTNPKRLSMMYGDIVIGMWWLIVVPVHTRDLWMMDANDPLLPGARIAYLSLVVALILTYCSIFTRTILFSRLSFLANVSAISAVNLLEFPFPGECAITPMMIGGTIIGVLANASLAFTEKMLRLPVYFAAGSYVCIHSPYCSYSNETRPILGGTVLLEMTALYVAHFGGLRKLLNHLESFEMNVAHLARLVLAMLFLHHLASTLLQLGDHNYPGHHYHNNGTTDIDLLPPETPVAEQFFVLVQAAVIACVGVAATGAFQEEINSKQRAERKAKEESMMSKAMADSMMVLTHELRTPLQGIMGATSMLLQKRTDNDNSNAANPEQQEKGDDESESLKLIMASSSLLLNLINNMLDVRRVTEGMMEDFPLTLFPASHPIRDAIGFCLPLASISNVSVVADYNSNGNPSTEHAVVRSNALRLQQVLINLISNAIKYTNADGDSKSVIRVSLRTTTVEDVNWHMKRALASSRAPEASRRNSVEQGKEDAQASHDRWATKRGDEKFLLFGVSDCGPGIDKVQANRLFRRFGRLDNKPKRTLGGNKVGQPSGTGLGLHLCQLFVQRMDGQIWASNNPNGQGATFFFCLPLGMEKKLIEAASPDRNLVVTKQVPTKQRLSSSSSTKKHHHHRNWGVRFGPTSGSRRDSSDKYSRDDSRRSSSNKSAAEIDMDGDTVSSGDSSKIPVFQRRVLVVDDTLINRKILDRMLKQIGLTKLATVGSGQAALKELYKHRYDLVITDLQMPGMSGMELSEAIHNIDDEFFSKPVVVGLTADTSLETVEDCKCSGMLDVIHKPITVEELKEFFERRISYLMEQNDQTNEFLEP